MLARIERIFHQKRILHDKKNRFFRTKNKLKYVKKIPIKVQ